LVYKVADVVFYTKLCQLTQNVKVLVFKFTYPFPAIVMTYMAESFRAREFYIVRVFVSTEATSMLLCRVKVKLSPCFNLACWGAEV
jgi:hypothetical protein